MDKDVLTPIVAKAQQGDSEALDALFKETYNDVYYFALKTVKDETLAADITQETFITIFQNLQKLNDPVAYPAWSRQITYRHCLQYLKKQNRETVADENEDGSTLFDSIEEDRTEFIPEDDLDQDDFKKTIMAMVDSLPEEQRTAVLLYYYDELSVKQIAEIQNVTEGTVKSRLNYGRKAIKSSVDDYEKKHNIKLHCAGVFPLLAWLFATDSRSAVIPTATAATVAAAISAATATTVATAAASTTAVVAATGGKVALALWQKIVIGIAATAVVAGGTVAVSTMGGDVETAATGTTSTLSSVGTTIYAQNGQGGTNASATTTLSSSGYTESGTSTTGTATGTSGSSGSTSSTAGKSAIRPTGTTVAVCSHNYVCTFDGIAGTHSHSGQCLLCKEPIKGEACADNNKDYACDRCSTKMNFAAAYNNVAFEMDWHGLGDSRGYGFTPSLPAETVFMEAKVKSAYSDVEYEYSGEWYIYPASTIESMAKTLFHIDDAKIAEMRTLQQSHWSDEEEAMIMVNTYDSATNTYRYFRGAYGGGDEIAEKVGYTQTGDTEFTVYLITNSYRDIYYVGINCTYTDTIKASGVFVTETLPADLISF